MAAEDTYLNMDKKLREKVCLFVCFLISGYVWKGPKAPHTFCFLAGLASCLHAYSDNGDRKHKRSP